MNLGFGIVWFARRIGQELVSLRRASLLLVNFDTMFIVKENNLSLQN